MKAINSLISLLMTGAALVYMFVMGYYWPEGVNAPLIVAIPPVALIAGAMWFLIKPDTTIEL